MKFTSKSFLAFFFALTLIVNSADSYAQSSPVTIKNTVPHGTITITAATTAGGVSGTFTTVNSKQDDSVLCSNAGAVTVFIAFGTGSATATVPTTETQGATAILAGESLVLTKGTGADTVAAITASSTSTLYCTAESGS